MARRYTVYGEGFRGISGAGIAMSIYDELTPFLKDYLHTYPRENKKALRHLCWWFQQELRKDIESGKAGKNIIPHLKQLHPSKIFDLNLMLAQKKINVRTYRKHVLSKAPYFATTVARDPNRMGKRLSQAIAFDKNSFKVGWTNWMAMIYGDAIQKGARGYYPHLNDTTGNVTPKMRKYFASIGMPLKKNTLKIEQKPRPIIIPILRDREARFAGIIAKRVDYNIRKMIEPSEMIFWKQYID